MTSLRASTLFTDSKMAGFNTSSLVLLSLMSKICCTRPTVQGLCWRVTPYQISTTIDKFVYRYASYKLQLYSDCYN